MNTVKAALDELEMLKDVVEQRKTNRGKNRKQRVPIRMRRRKAGTDERRLPKLLQSYRGATWETEPSSSMSPDVSRPTTPTETKKAKRLTRKVRRIKARKKGRAARGRAMAERAANENRKWLDTHIWHAKRCKMVDRWGYRLALHCNDHIVRVLYRAMKNYAVIQDISFMTCLEISGSTEIIKRGFERLTRRHLSGALNALNSTACETTMHLYEADMYPRRYIGEAWCTWQPGEGRDEIPEDVKENSRLIVWTHPAASQRIIGQLYLVFNLTRVPADHSIASQAAAAVSATASRTEAPHSPPRKRAKTKAAGTPGREPTAPREQREGIQKRSRGQSVSRKAELREKAVRRVTHPVTYVSQSGGEGRVVVRVLKDVYSRFRLTGPSSGYVLLDMFRPVDPAKLDVATARSPWVDPYYAPGTLAREQLADQEYPWNSLLICRIAHTPICNQVVPLTCASPSLNLPQKRTKAEYPTLAKKNSSQNCDDDSQILERDLSAFRLARVCPLYNADVRSQCAQESVTSWSTTKEGEIERWLPVVVVRQNCRGGARSRSAVGSLLGGGYDLIVPSGPWARCVWHAAILRCLSAVGLRDMARHNRETGFLTFPEDTVDSVCSLQEALEEEAERRWSYCRKPPSKRPCFASLGTGPCAFGLPWARLSRAWATSDIVRERGQFFVMRCPVILGLIARCMDGKKELKDVVLDELSESENLAVPFITVRITLTGKGVPARGAVVALLEPQDYSSDKDACEPLHINKIKAEFDEQLNELQKEAKGTEEKIALRRKCKPKGDTVPKDIEDPSADLISMCSRKTIGFVTSGHHGFAEGRGIAHATVAWTGFCEAIRSAKEHASKNQNPWKKHVNPVRVLVRNRNSLQYRQGCALLL